MTGVQTCALPICQVDVPLPTTAVTNEMLTAARGMGHAKQDFAVLFHTLATMSGLKTL